MLLLALLPVVACAERGLPVAGAAAARESAGFVGDCGDSLSVLEVDVDPGAPYRNWDWIPLHYFIPNNAQIVGNVLVLFIPKLEPRGGVEGLRALRFDLERGVWLADARYEPPKFRGLAPDYREMFTSALEMGVLVVWRQAFGEGEAGAHFSIADAKWRQARPEELTSLRKRGGLGTHAANPPNPEPVTGVSLEVDGPKRIVLLRRDAAVVASIRFESIPGTYIGAFGGSQTALLWTGMRHAEYQHFPVEHQFRSYLVHLRTGEVCRIERDLSFPGSAVFRTGDAIVFVNALMTEGGRSDCPPGAPCIAPEQPHFRGTSLVVLRHHPKNGSGHVR